MLSATSAAVAALLSPTPSEPSTMLEPSTRSVKISRSKIKEVSQQSILDRSDISQLARFLNTSPDLLQTTLDVSISNTFHREAMVHVVDSSILDESRHIIAPSTCSDSLSIIEAGSLQNSSKSSSSHNSLQTTTSINNSNNSAVSLATLSNHSTVSVRSNTSSVQSNVSVATHSKHSSHGNSATSVHINHSKGSASSAQSVKSTTSKNSADSAVVRPVLSKSSSRAGSVGDVNEAPMRDSGPVGGPEESHVSENSKSSGFSNDNPEFCSTPLASVNNTPPFVVSTPPPALPVTSKARKSLKQGLDTKNVVVTKTEEKKEEVRITQTSSQQLQARASLKQAVGSQSKGPKNVVVHTQSNVQPAPVTPDMASLITAAVAATAPIHQLRTDFEKKIEELSNKLRDYEERDKKAEPVSAVREPFNMTLATPLPRPPPRPTLLSADLSSEDSLALTVQKKTAKEVRAEFTEPRRKLSVEEDDVKCSELDMQREELGLMKENILELLQEARTAKDDIVKIRSEERVTVMRSRINDESPIDIFLEKISKRNSLTKQPKTKHVASVPAYVQRAKSLLSEIEEERKRYEDKSERYQPDHTYLCNESDEDDSVKKQISGVILDIQREVKDEMGKPQKKGPVSKLYTAKKAPVKRAKSLESAKVPVARGKRGSLPTKEQNLSYTKHQYEQLVANNEYQKLLANIGELKIQEGEMKSVLQEQLPSQIQLKKSPYARLGFPQSAPLSAPLQSKVIRRYNPERCEVKNNEDYKENIEQSLSESKGLRHSFSNKFLLRDDASYIIPGDTSPVPGDTSPVPGDTSLLRHSTLRKLPRNATQSRTQLPYDTPSLSHREHVHSVVETPLRSHYYTPSTPGSTMKKSTASDSGPNTSVRPTLELHGAYTQSPKQSIESREYFKAVSGRPLDEMKENDEQYTLRWLEDMVLDRLLQDAHQPYQDPALSDELTTLLGPEFEDKVRELGVGLDQQQLHNLVSDVMRDMVTSEMQHNITKKEEPAGPPTEKIEPVEDYSDSFTSSRHSSCSLSVLKTPSMTSRSESLQSLQTPEQQPRPVVTPLLSEIETGSPISRQVDPTPECLTAAPLTVPDSPPQFPLNQSDFNETSNMSAQSDPQTPALTSVSLRSTDSTFGVLGPAATPSITSLLTQLQSNIIEEPLNDDSIPDQSTIGHFLDNNGEPRSEPSDLSWEDPMVSNITISETTTTDLPISAGEILAGLPNELRNLNDMTALGALSEGEWPMSPGGLDVLEFIDDPDVRELFREQINAVSGPTIPLRVGLPSAASTFTETPNKQQARPPKAKKVVVQPNRPSPSPADLDMFNVTPLPPSSTSSDSQSPPPFMGLDYQDYISKESPSPRKDADDSRKDDYSF